jgi:hypothetical protein
MPWSQGMDKLPKLLKSSSLLESLEPNEYEIALPFFKDFQINETMLYLTLEKRGSGKVLTNSKTNPSFVLVYNSACYTFLGGELDQISLQAVVSYLKTLPKVSLACPTNWKYRGFLRRKDLLPLTEFNFEELKVWLR